LTRWIALAAAWRRGIGLNRLHRCLPTAPEQASPYAPNSRLFLNPLYTMSMRSRNFPVSSQPALRRKSRRFARPTWWPMRAWRGEVHRLAARL